ncbi:hypothetical protein X947_5161 [Burkholderia pseudomallei MSHR7334]|nr:hypothetical protein X947_5161 [Burkholderia pseudomallei MSHR7334]
MCGAFASRRADAGVRASPTYTRPAIPGGTGRLRASSICSVTPSAGQPSTHVSSLDGSVAALSVHAATGPANAFASWSATTRKCGYFSSHGAIRCALAGSPSRNTCRTPDNSRCRSASTSAWKKLGATFNTVMPRAAISRSTASGSKRASLKCTCAPISSGVRMCFCAAAVSKLVVTRKRSAASSENARAYQRATSRRSR